MKKKKILIFIVSYQSSFRLLTIMNKLKKINKKKDTYKILIRDDCSTDNTIDYLKKIKTTKKVKIIINKKNLGYGANIKKCLSYAIDQKFDYAIMIHGDDQYDSKYIPIMVKNLKKESVHFITGSRMINKKDALKGGMPLYKFFGNIVLSTIFNILCKTNFTDSHTGLWGYKLKIFNKIKLNEIDNAINFDSHLRIKAINNGLNIKEFPIKTYYRTEKSSWHFIYSFNFLKHLFINIFIPIK